MLIFAELKNNIMTAILHFIFVVLANLFMFGMLLSIIYGFGLLVYMCIQIAKGKGSGWLPWS